MTNYTHQLEILHQAIIEKNKDKILSEIKKTKDDFLSSTRISIYINAYTERLYKVTEADYPTLKNYLGEKLFTQAVQEFVLATPSLNWDLNLYSIQFADFFRTWSKDQGGYNLALLESTITKVFYLPDSNSLDPQMLSQINPEELLNKKFIFRAASELLSFDYAVHKYISEFRTNNDQIKLNHEPEYLFLVRHNNTIQRFTLDPMEYTLLDFLQKNEPFENALSQTANIFGDQTTQLMNELPQFLTNWFTRGFFTRLE
ncbi:MAG: DNA-binding domain-containing protein [Alphaproteobacteria bacterium]|nr:DNA-binding domain-containing protein [Alphaproteobacteria bacterium]